jgi:hypothetical protein
LKAKPASAGEKHMQKLELTSEELEMLREELDRRLGEIDIEVFRTDTHDFKMMLKHRQETLQRLREKIASLPVAA